MHKTAYSWRALIREASVTAPTQGLVRLYLNALWRWSKQIMAAIGRKLALTDSDIAIASLKEDWQKLR
jgi:hypothetical protein